MAGLQIHIAGMGFDDTPDSVPADAPLRVLLVGDDPLARGGLAALLAGQPGVRVVDQTAPGEGLATVALTARAQVACWDLGSTARPDLEPFRAARDLGLPVVALISSEGMAAEVLALGAVGLLLRTVEPSRFAVALQAAARGLVVIDDGLASGLLRERVEPRAVTGQEPLTPRELEVLQLLSQGLSNKQIADRLHISEHTAKFHVNAILEKLDATGRTEAVVRGARLGLILL